MRNFFSILLILLLAPATIIILLVWSFRSNILNPEFVKKELIAQQAYTTTANLFSDSFSHNPPPKGFPLTNAEWQNFLRQTVSPEWIRQNVEPAIDSLISWFNSTTNDKLTITINLLKVKENASKIFTAKPDLLSRELVKLIASLPNTIDAFTPALPQIFSDITPGWEKSGQQTLKSLESAKIYYQQFLHYYKLVLLIYVLLILVYIILQINSWHRLAKWSRIFMLTVGALPAVIGAGGRLFLEKYLIPMFNIDPTLSNNLRASMAKVLLDIASALFQPIFIIGVVLIIISLIFIIGARYLPTRPTAK